jgi:hypothetical protein
MAIRQVCGDFGRQTADIGSHGFEQLVGHVFLGPEVDLRFEPGKRAEQRGAPTPIEPAQRSVELAQRLARLRAGLGIDQVGEAFHGGEIEAAVQERPPRELARLRGPQAWHGRQGIEKRRDHRPTAVQLQLEDVLAGEAGGRRKPQDQSLVERLAATRVVHAAQRRPARRRRRPTGETAAGVAGCRPRQPHDGQRGPPRCSRRSEDRVGSDRGHRLIEQRGAP